MDGDEEKEEEEKEAPSLASGDNDESNDDEQQVRELEAARWYQPKYIDNEKLERCSWWFRNEVDKRNRRTSIHQFWGGDKGGCCHEASPVQGSGSGRC